MHFYFLTFRPKLKESCRVRGTSLFQRYGHSNIYKIVTDEYLYPELKIYLLCVNRIVVKEGMYADWGLVLQCLEIPEFEF